MSISCHVRSDDFCHVSGPMHWKTRPKPNSLKPPFSLQLTYLIYLSPSTSSHYYPYLKNYWFVSWCSYSSWFLKILRYYSSIYSGQENQGTMPQPKEFSTDLDTTNFKVGRLNEPFSVLRDCILTWICPLL